VDGDVVKGASPLVGADVCASYVTTIMDSGMK
jgi:hypothetical protein